MRLNLPAECLGRAQAARMNLVLNEKGRIRFLVWSEHRRVNIDVFGRRLVLKERLHHLVEARMLSR